MKLGKKQILFGFLTSKSYLCTIILYVYNQMKRFSILFLLFIMTTALSAQTVLELWPNGAPNSTSNPDDKAQLTAFLPKKERATGRAVIICPGGGYDHLAMQHEGTDWAPYFLQQGIAAFVLKYRMPHGNPDIPISDAQQALAMVRQNAKNWNIDPDQVGLMGSSAGGHLAATIATKGHGVQYPNFLILFYPVISMENSFTHRGSQRNLLGDKPSKKKIHEYSCDQQVTRATPRTFVALSDDDRAVPPINGANFYMECYRHDVPAVLHVYPTGGHGWGYRASFDYHIEMLLELKAWLKSF